MFILTFVFFVVSVYISAYTVVLVSCIAEDKPPLQDVIHNLSNKYLKLPTYIPLPEITVVIYSILCIIFCINMLEDIIFLVSILLLIRALFYCTTILPQVDRTKKKFTYTDLNFKAIIYHYYKKPYDLGGTNDLIFSAHVSIMVLLSLYITNYISLIIVIKWLIWITTIIMSIIIAIFKKHYTVDIISAYVTTLCIFSIYNSRTLYLF